MIRVSALIAMIACTQAITVHLESKTESEGLFDSVADSMINTVESASDLISNQVNSISDAIASGFAPGTPSPSDAPPDGVLNLLTLPGCDEV